MIVGQINFKGFGFNFHRLFFLNDMENEIRIDYFRLPIDYLRNPININNIQMTERSDFHQ